ncbi:MAG: hypothetical protein BWX54_01841 [Verrucomicrobia bacterium ADurb.Bin018]|nr:MAG: hypothetical protein BWX54_01841 [Verrucomicrobia bacterium ADurb.Bin018]
MKNVSASGALAMATSLLYELTPSRPLAVTTSVVAFTYSNTQVMALVPSPKPLSTPFT